MELTRRCEMTLEAAPPRFGQIRRIVQAQLRYWHLDPLIDPAVEGLTELLENVHRHAQPVKSCTVEMAYLAGCLTVSVHDADPRLPVRGRGMAIVAALCREWGAWNEDEGGKTVWFTLTDSRHPAHRHDGVRNDGVRHDGVRREGVPHEGVPHEGVPARAAAVVALG